MNKADLVAAVAEKTGLSKKNTQLVIDAMTDVISETLAEGNRVRLLGLGTFIVKDRAGRIGMNPKTKEPITILPSKKPVFKASKSLKEAL